MTTKSFSAAMSELEDKYVTEAINYKRSKKKGRWIKWTAVAACLCLILSAVIVQIISPIKTNVITADRFRLASSVSSLTEVSDIIIIAHADTAGENVLIKDKSGNLVFGYTNTVLAVDTVFKGDVSVGSTIEITEECYTTAWGTVLWTQEGYLPVQAGTQYILFLKAYSDGSEYAGKYFPVDLEFGKYVIPAEFHTETLTSLHNDRSALEIGNATNIGTYFEWYSSIMQKYFPTGKIGGTK